MIHHTKYSNMTVDELAGEVLRSDNELAKAIYYKIKHEMYSEEDLKNSYEEGLSDGWSDGNYTGEIDGYEDGYDAGYSCGYGIGVDEAHQGLRSV